MAYTESVYVKVTGNDTTGNGTIDNPYATLVKATTVVTTTNPIIYVDIGVFYVTYLQDLSKTGKTITIKGQGKDTTIYLTTYGSKNFGGNLELIDFILARDPASTDTTNTQYLIRAGDYSIINFRNILFNKTNSYPVTSWYNMYGSSSTANFNKSFYNCTFKGNIPTNTAGYGICTLSNCATTHSTTGSVGNVLNNTMINATIDSSYKLTNYNNDTYGVFSGDYTWYLDRFLIYKDNIYYTIDENNLIVQTVLDNTTVFNVGFRINKFLDTNIINSQLLKDISPFKLVVINSNQINYTSLQLNALKNKNELIILNQKVGTNLATSITKYFTTNTVGGTGNIKMVVSTDDMLTWKTWNGTSWVNLTNTTTNKSYASMTTDEKTQWETFKTEIVNTGMTDIVLQGADFNQFLGQSLRFAFVLIKSAYSDVSTLKNLQWTYVGKDNYVLLNNTDIKVSLNEDYCKVTPMRNIDKIKVNILT